MPLYVATRLGTSLVLRIALLVLALLSLAFVLGAPGSDPIILPY